MAEATAQIPPEQYAQESELSTKMMRIKEAIQRKKLIHEMNEEWKDYDFEALGSNSIVLAPSPICQNERSSTEEDGTEQRLQDFVQYISGKLNEYQKRALKVTWKRLSEAPRTSGRGTIHIMEKILNKFCEHEPSANSIFYRSAFLSCIEDRRYGRKSRTSISTLRDHAHILVEFIDGILQCMFEGTVAKPGLDPVTIGINHAKLCPLGFDRRMWHVFGECFAEVMFMQDCIRAYPHAPSAWSHISVAMTDSMFAAGKIQRPISIRNISRGCSADTNKSRKSIEDTDSDEAFYTARETLSEQRPPTMKCLSATTINNTMNHAPHCPAMIMYSPARTYITANRPLILRKPSIIRSKSELSLENDRVSIV